MELIDHLGRIVGALEREGIPYALCGGLAMAVYSAPRATMDIDLVVREGDVPRIRELAARQGFTLDVGTIPTRAEGVVIHRLSCPDPDLEDVVPLDLIPVSPAIQQAWETRTEVEWEGGRLWVVSREGLAAMKSLRGSPLDLEDIRRLREG